MICPIILIRYTFRGGGSYAWEENLLRRLVVLCAVVLVFDVTRKWTFTIVSVMWLLIIMYMLNLCQDKRQVVGNENRMEIVHIQYQPLNPQRG